MTPTETRTFLYDGWNMVHEHVFDKTAGAIAETHDYYWGRDLSGSLQGAGGVGGLLAYTRNGALRIPVYDHIGNIVAVVDDSGAIVAAYEYDPFGNIIAQSGTEADEVPFRFSTKYFDPETGLYYYGYRFYSPELGRWINRDPLGEKVGRNLYLFATNASLLDVDYLGNIAVKVMSRKENGPWGRMIDKGNRYRDIEVKSPADIIIYWQRFINIYGRFRPYPPIITDCGKTVIIQTEIALDNTLVGSPNTGVVYRFAPHSSQDGHLIDNPSSTSDGSPFVLLPIKLHEYAHARVFLNNVIPLFKTKLDNRFGDVIPAGSESEVKALLDEAQRECIDLEVELTTSEELRGFQQLNMIGVLLGGEYHFKTGE